MALGLDLVITKPDLARHLSSEKLQVGVSADLLFPKNDGRKKEEEKSFVFSLFSNIYHSQKSHT